MKILQTSDWHLGHTLYNYDRTEEQLAMLLQMVETVRLHRPDVLLICGDIYHTPQPSSSVQTMLTNALLEIHKARPDMAIVMTAGNHDSGAKHEIFRTAWRELNVFAIGQIERDNPEGHIIEIPGKGYVIALPYASERNLPESFYQLLTDMAAERNKEGLPVVMMAHTTVKGADFSGHDHATDSIVGGIDAVDLSQMGNGYDYLALGHIHHEQFVHGGEHRVRYCGSPLPVSFDESYPHSVSLVEIEHHGQLPKVKRIEIENPRPLVTLPTDDFASWEEAKELLAAFPDDIPAYIRLNVEIEDFLPAEAQAEAQLLTEHKQCRFCCINAKRKSIYRAEARMLSVQEFQDEDPIDIAQRYAEDMGVEFDEEMTAMFGEVINMVEEESRND